MDRRWSRIHFISVSVDSNGNVLSQKQFHGNISRIELERGIFIEIAESGAEFAVPPDFSVIQVAEPGEYKLKETEEVVVNPDLIAIWRIEKP